MSAGNGRGEGGRGLSRRWGAVLAIAALALGACAHRFGRLSGPELRLEVPAEVRWETGARHQLTLAIRNAGSTAIDLATPSAAAADLAVFSPTESTPVCRAGGGAPGGGASVRMAPGARTELTLVARCALAPGEYRYEAWYRPADAVGGASRRVGPERGRIVVRPSGSAVEFPASRGAVSPPGAADSAPPPQPNPHLARPAPPEGPRSLACVDRELAHRGLNAYGDPAGTLYPDGPPTLGSDVERERMVLERYPDIGTLCRVPP